MLKRKQQTPLLDRAKLALESERKEKEAKKERLIKNTDLLFVSTLSGILEEPVDETPRPADKGRLIEHGGYSFLWIDSQLYFAKGVGRETPHKGRYGVFGDIQWHPLRSLADIAKWEGYFNRCASEA